jgi:hypothetical protein
MKHTLLWLRTAMMAMYDPQTEIGLRREQLLAEAQRERLVALVPHTNGGVRRNLAVACVKLANWLDEPAGYVQLPDAGREDWAAPWASV